MGKKKPALTDEQKAAKAKEEAAAAAAEKEKKTTLQLAFLKVCAGTATTGCTSSICSTSPLACALSGWVYAARLAG